MKNIFVMVNWVINWKLLLTIHIYMYIYIYIIIHRQTISLYHKSSVWLDTQNTSSWDQNPPNFTQDMSSKHSAISEREKEREEAD